MSRKGSLQDAGEATDNPFARLAELRATLPEAPTPLPSAAPPGQPNTAKPAKPAPKGPAKAVVRLERKGRGGKDATIIEQLGLSASELETWLKALKTQLGCGGTVEDGTLVLQGDLRKRLAPLLEARGVRKIVVA